VVTAVENQRQSVSGVSLDEEMTNLITFQRGYQSSARTLTAMDEMLNTLINHTGAVGL
jgi:flagellar hook-associated protein 1 FlgK